MHRRTLLSAALALAAAGCAGPSAVTSSAPSTTGGTRDARAVIGLSYIPNVQFAPFYVAEADQLFDPVAAQVSLRHHGATESLFTALSSGTEDFLVAAGSEAMQARAEGVDVIAVGAYYKSFPVQVLVLESSPIVTLADLKGRRLGVPGRYGESWLAVQVALQTAGLSESDVTIVEVGYTQVAALTLKKVDAVVGFTTNELVQLQLAGDTPRALPVAEGTVPLVSTCLLTTGAYAKAHPQVVRQVVTAVKNAIQATAADQSRAIDVAGRPDSGLDGHPAAQRRGRAPGVGEPDGAARWRLRPGPGRRPVGADGPISRDGQAAQGPGDGHGRLHEQLCRVVAVLPGDGRA
ncbi:ABC transporter substrate-binding protein [Micropruina sp.]|uniref:ABC transporter substrate-binding protein n=1 Tax=Micropruina sp. TaxID=2737536 RepID=UPI0039E3F505